jgi:predicted nucleic acid-binding protein
MIVVDASVWVSFLVRRDVHHAASRAWLAERLLEGTPLAAPVILLSEVGGALARRLDRPEIGVRAIERLLAIPTLRLTSVDHALGIRAGNIAAQYRLRGADAIYVAVAAALEVPLVSWDQQQVERAGGMVTAYAPGM